MSAHRSKKTISFSAGLALMLGFSLFFAGCGGGGGGGSSAPATTSTLSVGPATQANSIIVNGVHFETEGAELEFENETPEIITGDDSAIRDGMNTEVRGPVNQATDNGSATSIFIEDTVEGPVIGDGGAAAVTTPNLIKQINVLGQNVILENGFTEFDTGLAFSTDFTGMFLEVHGPLANGDNAVRATYVEQKNPGGILEVKGVVDSVNNATSTFTINGLTVDYSTTAPINLDVPAVGDQVEVKGSVFDNATTTLTATSVEVEGGFDDVAEAEIEGFVSDLTATTFIINGQMVDYSGAAFIGGPEADLANGEKVEAEGPIVNGILVAQKIKFKESLRIESNVSVVAGNVLTLEGLGINVILDSALTRNDLDTPAQVGDGVKIRARRSGSTFVATRIDDLSQQNRAEIQGKVEAFDQAAQTVTIAGIMVDTSTIGEFQSLSDQLITEAAFFAALAADPDALVKARLNLSTGLWTQIQFEAED